MLFATRRRKVKQPTSLEPHFVAEVRSSFDGRKWGPIGGGSSSTIGAWLWIFDDYIEYVDGLGRIKRLDRDGIESVTTRLQLFGGRVVFNRVLKNSILEFGFRSRKDLQAALSVMKANGFPLSDRAISLLHS